MNNEFHEYVFIIVGLPLWKFNIYLSFFKKILSKVLIVIINCEYIEYEYMDCVINTVYRPITFLVMDVGPGFRTDMK